MIKGTWINFEVQVIHFEIRNFRLSKKIKV
jgi:hypothetical protein